MTHKSIVLIIFLFSFHLSAQDYKLIDEKVLKYPGYNDIHVFTERLYSDFKTDSERVRALFVWIVENIKYNSNDSEWTTVNLEFYLSDYQKKRGKKQKEERLIAKSLKNKKANCYGYSLIFKKACDLLHIESEIITGYSRGNLNTIGKKITIKNHAWNAVKLSNQWKLLDIAWTNGYLEIEKADNNGYYYFKSPKEFLNQHLPVNPKWQLVSNKLSKKEFISRPILYPKYYSSKFKLAKENNGIIKISKANKHIEICFNNTPDDPKISYAYFKDRYSTPISLKKNNDGANYIKIKYNKKEDSYLTLYSNFIPVIGYKVEYCD